DSGMSRQDEILPAADEVAAGQVLDLDTLDGLGIEVPIEACQGFEFGEASFVDAAGQAAFAAQASLVGDETVQELQVGAAVLGSLGQGGVEVRGAQGDTQRAEVGQDALTQVLEGCRLRSRRWSGWGTAGHRCKPPVSVSVDSQPWVALPRDRRAGTVRGAGVPARPGWPGCFWAWR